MPASDRILNVDFPCAECGALAGQFCIFEDEASMMVHSPRARLGIAARRVADTLEKESDAGR